MMSTNWFFKMYNDRCTLKVCFQTVLLAYSFYVILNSISYLSLFSVALLTIGVYYVVKHFCLPRGDEMLVKEVLGADVYDDLNGDGLKEDNQSGEDVYKMKIVAHRFAGLDAPENSLAALDNCYKAGCSAVEFDISITSDNEIILFHDDTLDRLTGSTGHISKMSWSQLSSVDISTNHPFREQFANTRIAKFDEVIEKCIEYDLRMFIDIKDSKQEVIDGVCKMFEKYPMMYRRAVVSSFNPWIIYQIRCRKPSIVGCLAWRPYYISCHNYIPENASSQERRSTSPVVYYLSRVGDYFHQWAYFTIIHMLLGISCVLIHKDMITKESIQWWRSKNIRCIAWTVNQPSEKQHFAKNLRITYLTDTMHAN